MQTLYFYHALRKRGCNVVLARFPRESSLTAKQRRKPQPTPMPGLALVPQPAQLKPPPRELKSPVGNSTDIVVPAGIRSVRRVLDRLGGGVVVNSGSAVKGLAYDRSTKQDFDYSVNLELHSSEKNLLPTFRLKTTHVRTWRRKGKKLSGSPLAPSNVEAVEAFLSTGVWKVGDWHKWLERAIIPYFRDFVRRTRLALQEHAIMDAHIGDYLYAEPALIAAKVKDRGGRVHLWPHSTNPVHVDFHDPNHVASVRAVTKSGVESWQRVMPKAEIVHDPTLMLEAAETMVSYSSSDPISIVVIGGRPIIRNLPILDIAAHEDLYRRFFASLEPAVRAGRVRVFFKPRGRTGEHESWLENLVGRSATWQRVLEHPLRMTLPNPVFVSLSVGSSALLEGVARGIPGFIVREGFARDYLATADHIFETLTMQTAVDLIDRLAEEPTWETYRAAQVRGLAYEIGD